MSSRHKSCPRCIKFQTLSCLGSSTFYFTKANGSTFTTVVIFNFNMAFILKCHLVAIFNSRMVTILNYNMVNYFNSSLTINNLPLMQITNLLSQILLCNFFTPQLHHILLQTVMVVFNL